MSVPPRLFKLAAAGNDFLVVDARAHPGHEWDAREARLACRRNRGLGADGVVTLGPSSVADATFNLRNCDGSRAAFSGNGARCAARLLGFLGADRDGAVSLETSTGVIAARILGDAAGTSALVEVEVAPPRDIRLALTLPPGSPAAQGDYAIVGVPYLAIAVASVDDLDLPLIAPQLRRWKDLPDGANVAFYEAPPLVGEAPPLAGEIPSADAPVRLRTWERGVEGETLSSGTGCAMIAGIVALRDGREGERIVHLDTRSRAPLSVTVTMESGAVRSLVLRGEALLLGEIHAGPDLLTPDP